MNLLPYSVYKQLGLGELKPTKVTLQLADRSIKVPKGMIEDVLIKIRDFVFPMDFIILETELVSNPRGQIPLILGQPFLATSNVIINCRDGMMKLSFGNMMVELNIFHSGKPHSDESDQPLDLNFIQDTLGDKNASPVDEDPLALCLAHFGLDFDVEGSIQEVNALLESVPYFSLDTWTPESSPPSAFECLDQPPIKPWSSDEDQSCLVVAMPLEPEPPEHFMEDILESFDVGVPCMFDEYPWSKVLWCTEKRVRNLLSHMSWAHYTHKTLREPQFEKLVYETPPPNVTFYVEF